MSLIKMNNISKTYSLGDENVYILKNINFHVESEEMLSIMGASGSGKSTLMNLIGLLDSPTSGDYILEGSNIHDYNENQLAHLRNQTIGFVFQSFFLLPRLTAWQNVALPLLYSQKHRGNVKQYCLEMLDKVGMSDRAMHKPQELSGGQQQRVAIARALINEPSVILADEPTGALDSKIGQEVMDLFIHLNQQEKKTLILVTHDPNVASQCQRVVHVQDGQIKDEEISR